MERDSFNYKHAFWTATVGGAKCLGLEGKVGRILHGHALGACVVDLSQWLDGDGASVRRRSRSLCTSARAGITEVCAGKTEQAAPSGSMMMERPSRRRSRSLCTSARIWTSHRC